MSPSPIPAIFLWWSSSCRYQPRVQLRLKLQSMCCRKKKKSETLHTNVISVHHNWTVDLNDQWFVDSDHTTRKNQFSWPLDISTFPKQKFLQSQTVRKTEKCKVFLTSANRSCARADKHTRTRSGKKIKCKYPAFKILFIHF